MSYAVNIKPLSSNNVWRGGPRYRTAQYKTWDDTVQFLLPKTLHLPDDGPLDLAMIASVSNAASDLDNLIKPFLDSLQKRYAFNDKRIYRIQIEKRLVQRGQESIVFDLGPLPA